MNEHIRDHLTRPEPDYVARNSGQTHPCEFFTGQLVEFDEGLLAPAEAKACAEHARLCYSCSETLAAIQRVRARLENAGRNARDSATTDAVMRRIQNGPKPAERGVHRRLIMPRALRYAAATAASAALLTTGWMFWPSSKPQGVAFAGVLAKAKQAKSVKFRVTHYAGEPKTLGTMMIYGDSLIRSELSDGKIMVGNLGTGEHLVLYHDRKLCVHGKPSGPEPMAGFKFYEQFTTLRDAMIEDLGLGEHEGRLVQKFRATPPAELKLQGREDGLITVTADVELNLPISIEYLQEDPKPDGTSSTYGIVLDEMEFDTLDESLFSLTPPTGYEVVPAQLDADVGGRHAAQNMKKIVMACMIYQQEHDVWPETITGLERYGIDAKTLFNPRRPDLDIGFTYIRPSTTAQPNDVMLYDTINAWTGWAAVGFFDGRVEIIRDREQYVKIMESVKR